MRIRQKNHVGFKIKNQPPTLTTIFEIRNFAGGSDDYDPRIFIRWHIVIFCARTHTLIMVQWCLWCYCVECVGIPVRVCCPWRMPSANPKLEKQASTEAFDPIRQAIIVIEHKIRNLEKRKVLVIILLNPESPKIRRFPICQPRHPLGSAIFRWTMCSST